MTERHAEIKMYHYVVIKNMSLQSNHGLYNFVPCRFFFPLKGFDIAWFWTNIKRPLNDKPNHDKSLEIVLVCVVFFLVDRARTSHETDVYILFQRPFNDELNIILKIAVIII